MSSIPKTAQFILTTFKYDEKRPDHPTDEMICIIKNYYDCVFKDDDLFYQLTVMDKFSSILLDRYKYDKKEGKKSEELIAYAIYALRRCIDLENSIISNRLIFTTSNQIRLLVRMGHVYHRYAKALMLENRMFAANDSFYKSKEKIYEIYNVLIEDYRSTEKCKEFLNPEDLLNRTDVEIHELAKIYKNNLIFKNTVYKISMIDDKYDECLMYILKLIPKKYVYNCAKAMIIKLESENEIVNSGILTKYNIRKNKDGLKKLKTIINNNDPFRFYTNIASQTGDQMLISSYRNWCQKNNLFISFMSYFHENINKKDYYDIIEYTSKSPEKYKFEQLNLLFNDIKNTYSCCRYDLFKYDVGKNCPIQESEELKFHMNIDNYDYHKIPDYYSKIREINKFDFTLIASTNSGDLEETSFEVLKNCILRIYSIFDKISKIITNEFPEIYEKVALNVQNMDSITFNNLIKYTIDLKLDEKNKFLNELFHIFREINPDSKINKKETINYTILPSAPSINRTRNMIAHCGLKVYENNDYTFRNLNNKNNNTYVNFISRSDLRWHVQSLFELTREIILLTILAIDNN